MAALHQFLEILLKPDNIPIAGMLVLVLFFTWVGFRQALRNEAAKGLTDRCAMVMDL